MTHELKTPFSIYTYTFDEKQEEYEKMITKIGKVFTVEQFWNVYSHIVPLSKIGTKNGIHIFKNDSRAMREDPENSNGGSFLMRIPKTTGMYYWEQLVLSLIGGQLPDDIIGVVISARPKNFNISIWHQTGGDLDYVQSLCEAVAKAMKLTKQKIDYTPHKEINEVGEEGQKTAITTFHVENDYKVKRNNSPINSQ